VNEYKLCEFCTISPTIVDLSICSLGQIISNYMLVSLNCTWFCLLMSVSAFLFWLCRDVWQLDSAFKILCVQLTSIAFWLACS